MWKFAFTASNADAFAEPLAEFTIVAERVGAGRGCSSRDSRQQHGNQQARPSLHLLRKTLFAEIRPQDSHSHSHRFVKHVLLKDKKPVSVSFTQRVVSWPWYSIKTNESILLFRLGFKPLKCRHCFRAFGDPSNLNKHIRLHNQHSDGHHDDGANETPAYKCHICNKGLHKRRDLQRHMQLKHSTNGHVIEDSSADASSITLLSQSSPSSSSDEDIAEWFLMRKSFFNEKLFKKHIASMRKTWLNEIWQLSWLEGHQLVKIHKKIGRIFFRIIQSEKKKSKTTLKNEFIGFSNVGNQRHFYEMAKIKTNLKFGIFQNYPLTSNLSMILEVKIDQKSMKWDITNWGSHFYIHKASPSDNLQLD